MSYKHTLQPAKLVIQQTNRGPRQLMGISPSVVIDGAAYWADAVPGHVLESLSTCDRGRVARIAAAIERVRKAGGRPER